MKSPSSLSQNLDSDRGMSRVLSERREEVLRAVVEHCIRHFFPMGSQTIASTAKNLGSPATIRKEMRWLEEQGYLSQPHTSAGRVPTELGYRYFVDLLMGPCVLKKEEMRVINYFFGHISGEAEQNLMETSQLLSDVTHCASIVLSPKIESASILSLQLVKLSAQVALLVAVLSNGAVEKRTLEFPDGVTEEELHRASEILSQTLIDGRSIDSHFYRHARRGLSGEASVDRDTASGEPPRAWRPLTPDPFKLSENDFDLRHIVEAAWNALSELALHPQEHIFIGGTSELAGVFDTIETLREILATLEQQYIVVTMLRDLVERGVKVSIGSENHLPPLHECALVVAPYRASDSKGGSVAVIGPTHMNYPKAMAAVAVVSGQLSDLLCE